MIGWPFILCFLDAPSHLCKRSCPSVNRSVGPSVRRSVCPVLFSKEISTHTRRILRRVPGLVSFFSETVFLVAANVSVGWSVFLSLFTFIAFLSYMKEEKCRFKYFSTAVTLHLGMRVLFSMVMRTSMKGFVPGGLSNHTSNSALYLEKTDMLHHERFDSSLSRTIDDDLVIVEQSMRNNPQLVSPTVDMKLKKTV